MIDLVARLRLKDDMTNPLRRATKQIDSTSQATNKLSSSVGGARGGMSKLAASVGAVVSAYAAAAGAVKLFNATIGAAAKYEQSEVAVNAIFNDKEASSAYLAMVDKMSIDSPLLSSGEMLSSSKGLVAMTKNVNDLGDAWSVIERLMVLDPTQGTEGAAFALKEMWSGDSLSMVDRFGLNKGELNRIKKLDIPQQIAEISKLLDGMGITEATVNSMGGTTLGLWQQITERAEKFMRVIGSDGNSKLGKALEKVIKMFDNSDLDGMATKLGDALGTIVEKAIEVGKFLWKWREPIAYIVGALAIATTAIVAIGAIAAIGVELIAIATGIGGVAIGFIAMYKNSEMFRAGIDKILGRVKTLYQAFQTGGAGGLLDAMFGDGTAEKVTGIINTIKTKFSEMKSGFEIVKNALAQGWSLLMEIFTNAWTIIGPVLSGLWSYLQIIGDVAVIVFNNVIAPALSFLMQLFSTLWSIAQPILQVLASLFQALGATIKLLWDTILAPLVEFIMGGVKNAFDAFTEALQYVEAAFDSISGVISSVQDEIGEFAGVLSSVKLPDWVTNGVSTAVGFVGKLIGAKPKGSHYHGLDSVPYDGYMAKLHRGEMVLNKHEANAYRTAKASTKPLANSVTNLANYSSPVNNVTNDMSTSKLTNVYDMAQNYVKNIVEGAVSTLTETFNTIYNGTTNEDNSVSNVAYNSHIAQPYGQQAQQPVVISQPESSGQNVRRGNITVAKLAEQIIVREQADIDRIADGLVRKLIEAEAAGV